MRALPVKEQFRPTLPQLLTPCWQGLSQTGRRSAIGAGVALLIAIAALALALPRDPWIVHHGQTSFSLQYPSVMHRVATAPGADETVDQLVHGHLFQSLSAGPLQLPRFSGDINGELPIYAAGYIAKLARTQTKFVLSSEGKTRVGSTPGYWFSYREQLAGRTYFGRVIFLVPLISGVRDGATLSMLSVPLANVETPDQVAVDGDLYEPLHTFSFGA